MAVVTSRVAVPVGVFDVLSVVIISSVVVGCPAVVGTTVFFDTVVTSVETPRGKRFTIAMFIFCCNGFLHVASMFQPLF